MERQESSGVATECLLAASRSLLNGTGHGAAAARTGLGLCDMSSQGDR
jgi:hypothetical protein